jgi:hypothetical protein
MRVWPRWFNAQECGGGSTKMSKFRPEGITTSITPMNIEGTECVANLFSIFHDGSISHANMVNGNLVLEVGIRYLAQRINPSFKKFILCLYNIRGVRFSTWPSNSEMQPSEIIDTSLIFRPELKILEGNPIGGSIQVICNVSSKDCDYSGGELYFQADFAHVTDEAGRPYSFSELCSLSSDYWEEWSSRSQA